VNQTKDQTKTIKQKAGQETEKKKIWTCCVKLFWIRFHVRKTRRLHKVVEKRSLEIKLKLRVSWINNALKIILHKNFPAKHAPDCTCSWSTWGRCR
jgi:hypothetical protein